MQVVAGGPRSGGLEWRSGHGGLVLGNAALRALELPSITKTNVFRIEHIVHLEVKQYGKCSRRMNLRRQ